MIFIRFYEFARSACVKKLIYLNQMIWYFDRNIEQNFEQETTMNILKSWLVSAICEMKCYKDISNDWYELLSFARFVLFSPVNTKLIRVWQ